MANTIEDVLKKQYEGKLYSAPGDDEIRSAMQEWASLQTPSNEKLKTLQTVKEVCELYSDSSARTLGYNWVCSEIRKLESTPIPILTPCGWVKFDDEQPKEEGRYLCCRVFDLITKPNLSYFVSNFHFFTMRESGERVIDSDGITGCFQSDSGYGEQVTFWMPLPTKPNL